MSMQENPLFLSLSSGDFDLAHDLIRSGADLNPYGGELVRMAVLRAPPFLVKAMVDAGLNVTVEDEGGRGLLWLLLEDADAQIEQGDYAFAFHRPLTEKFHTLVSAGADIHQKGMTKSSIDLIDADAVGFRRRRRDVDEESLRRRHPKGYRLVEDFIFHDPCSLMYAAVRAGLTEIVHTLIRMGVPVNDFAETGLSPLLDCLLSADRLEGLFQSSTDTGFNAERFRAPYIECIQALILSGADPMARPEQGCHVESSFEDFASHLAESGLGWGGWVEVMREALVERERQSLLAAVDDHPTPLAPSRPRITI